MSRALISHQNKPHTTPKGKKKLETKEEELQES